MVCMFGLCLFFCWRVFECVDWCVRLFVLLFAMLLVNVFCGYGVSAWLLFVVNPFFLCVCLFVFRVFWCLLVLVCCMFLLFA